MGNYRGLKMEGKRLIARIKKMMKGDEWEGTET